MKAFFFGLLAVLLCAVRSPLAQAQSADSAKLPFAISKEKKLSDQDLADKKEGTYLTGVPDLSSDPVNGFGYGGEGSLFFNGKRSDPFFQYTAYRARLDLALFNTTRAQRELMLRLDVPYAFNTRWRLRVEAGYESNPNLLYFGTTTKSLRGLSYYPNQDSSLPEVINASYAQYEKNALVGSYQHYHNYIKKELILNVSAERSYLDGTLRALVGYEVASVGISTFSGQSLLRNQAATQSIPGIGKPLVGIFQLGLIYDTRDLETDPGKGIFAELTNELSLPALGSAFQFNKTFFHANLYQNLLSKSYKKLVLAARIAAGYTGGAAPFFEYQDQWSSEGSIEGLGGAHTLRGYKQARFLGRVMSFNNLELRYRFAALNLLRQHLVFVAVPFADAGAVWDRLANLSHLQNFRHSEGLGLRILWNVNTVLRFDYAISKEDHQFFFNMSHAF